MGSGILIPACAGHACHLHVQAMLVAWFKVGSEISIPVGLVSVSAMKCGRSSVACEPNAEHGGRIYKEILETLQN